MELPKENELVVAVVKKIMPYGAFCTLPDYGDMEGFMHISEVAPRWIKNIHEFLSEKQKLIVKVHRVDREKNQVDLSLKRVTEEERKNKLEGKKKEVRATKLLQVAIKKAKSRKTFEKLREEVEAEYGDLYSFLETVRDEGEEAFSGLDLPKELKAEITELAGKYVKKPVAEITRVFTISCYESNGVEVVKSALEGVPAHYLGAGRYQMKMETEDPKAGEKEMDRFISKIEKGLKGKDCTFSIEES